MRTVGNFLVNIIAGTTTIKATMHSNGNLILIGVTGNTWSSNTSGNPGAYLAVKDNGEFVIKTSSGNSIWSSKTQSNCTGMYFFCPPPYQRTVLEIDIIQCSVIIRFL